MTKLFAALALFAFAFSAGAETKILKVGGMHCEDCAAQVRDKLCASGEFKTCEVKVINEKKEIGQIKLVTKGDTKIDMVKVAKIIEDEGYTLKK